MNFEPWLEKSSPTSMEIRKQLTLSKLENRSDATSPTQQKLCRAHRVKQRPQTTESQASNKPGGKSVKYGKTRNENVKKTPKFEPRSAFGCAYSVTPSLYKP